MRVLGSVAAIELRKRSIESLCIIRAMFHVKHQVMSYKIYVIVRECFYQSAIESRRILHILDCLKQVTIYQFSAAQ